MDYKALLLTALSNSFKQFCMGKSAFKTENDKLKTTEKRMQQVHGLLLNLFAPSIANASAPVLILLHHCILFEQKKFCQTPTICWLYSSHFCSLALFFLLFPN